VQRAHCYEGSRGPGRRARESSTAAVAVAVAEVGCNGERERGGGRVSRWRERDGERSAGFQSTFYCL